MSRPEPSDEAVQYTAEVTVKFYFEIEADDDIQAEDIASYDWQEYLYRGEIQNIRVDMVEEDSDIPEYGDATDAGIADE